MSLSICVYKCVTMIMIVIGVEHSYSVSSNKYKKKKVGMCLYKIQIKGVDVPFHLPSFTLHSYSFSSSSSSLVLYHSTPQNII